MPKQGKRRARDYHDKAEAVVPSKRDDCRKRKRLAALNVTDHKPRSLPGARSRWRAAREDRGTRLKHSLTLFAR